MRATGIVRRVDDLGRFVIPKEIRKNFDIGEGEPMEIFTTNQGIFIQKASLDATPDIFKEMGCAEVPAQPPIKTESRKKVIYRDNNQNEDYRLYLTDDQIALLEWMVGREYILDGNYEIIEDIEFFTP